MNAGLSNLATLKQHLLPDTWETETNLDDLLVTLGLGVASKFEEYCARKLVRTVGETFDCDASPMVIQLPRFPIETISEVALRSAGSAVWEVQSDSIDNFASKAGLVYLTATIGTMRDRLRITYTGGFWFNTVEPPTAADALPAGATAIPAGLQLAWLLQCQHVFAARELLHIRSLPSGEQADPKAASVGIELLPAVRDALQPYRILAA